MIREELWHFIPVEIVSTRSLPIWDRMQAKLDTLVKIIRDLISDRYVCKGERRKRERGKREVSCSPWFYLALTTKISFLLHPILCLKMFIVIFWSVCLVVW